MSRRMANSIADVAADAGVSMTTVSHALSGKRSVSAETRRRVFESVKRLDYRPNLLARGLRSKRTHTIALLVSDISNPFYPSLARSISDVLSMDDYVSFICNTDGDIKREKKFLHESVARGVDGIIIQAMVLSSLEIRDIVGEHTALVMLGGPEMNQTAAHCDQVTTDDRTGIREAVLHLIASARNDIAFVTGPEGTGPSEIRLEAFTQAMHESGVTVEKGRTFHTPFTRNGGASAAEILLDNGSMPQAIMCANDLIAIGVMDTVQTRGLRIPEDIAVIGFDSIETADLVRPRLTSIDNFAAALGSAAATLLLTRMTRGANEPYETVVLPTKLVLRESA